MGQVRDPTIWIHLFCFFICRMPLVMKIDAVIENMFEKPIRVTSSRKTIGDESNVIF